MPAVHRAAFQPSSMRAFLALAVLALGWVADEAVARLGGYLV